MRKRDGIDSDAAGNVGTSLRVGRGVLHMWMSTAYTATLCVRFPGLCVACVTVLRLCVDCTELYGVVCVPVCACMCARARGACLGCVCLLGKRLCKRAYV